MDAPKKLNPYAKKLWNLISKEIEVPASMHETLAQYCNDCSKYWYCESVMEKEGFTVDTERGGVKSHPLVTQQQQASDRSIKGAKLLGLTAAIRQVDDVDEIEEFTKGNK